MKKFKKAMALSLALAMGLSLVACGDEKKDDTTDKKDDTTASEATEEDTTASESEVVDAPATMEAPSADGAAIHVYSWNDELGNRINTHFNSRYPELADLVVYHNLDLGGTSADYQTKIQNAIDAGGEEVPSIVAADNDVALVFAEKDYTIALEDAGLTAEMYANAYDYTVQYGTIDGTLKAMTWQATPGCYVYNTEVAEAALGTSDPAEVQEFVKDWDTFFETAETLKAAGKYILSGVDDVKYVCIDQKTSKWVEDGALNIDDAIVDYLETSKKLYDGGYTTESTMWDATWTANMKEDNVLGWFGCTWFVPWSLDTDGANFGNWRVCVGPADYHWGGSYLCITDDCPNKELAAFVLYTLCCDSEVAYDLYDIDKDYPNNKLAVQNLIKDGKGANDKLGGQDPLVAWDEMAQGISLKYATSYDAIFNTYADVASGSYNTGDKATIDEAVAYIKEQVANAYSDIVVE